MEEEEISKEDIKKIMNTLKKYSMPIIFICLFFLFFQLGFMYGYNQSFNLQEDYYEEKMLKYCVCQDKPTYNMPNQPLEINFNSVPRSLIPN